MYIIVLSQHRDGNCFGLYLPLLVMVKRISIFNILISNFYIV